MVEALLVGNKTFWGVTATATKSVLSVHVQAGKYVRAYAGTSMYYPSGIYFVRNDVKSSVHKNA